MAGKPRPIVIEVPEFRVYLAARMGAKRQSAEQLAEELGVTRQAIYQLLNGELNPSDQVARKVGLRPAFIVEMNPEGDSPAPAKGKSKK